MGTFYNKMGTAHRYQKISLLVLYATSIASSAPGGNPDCQVDGSREPVCDGSWPPYFPHESDCGKYWECGADLQPCLFDCPAISEDIGGGTLLFNTVKQACDWPVTVDCQNDGCCDSLNVAGKLFADGEYRKLPEHHNRRPVYQHTDGKYCIFYGGHWKIDTCNFLTDGDWTQGYGWSDVNAMCPGDIGPQWRYYSWDGSSDSGPVDTEIVVECM